MPLGPPGGLFRSVEPASFRQPIFLARLFPSGRRSARSTPPRFAEPLYGISNAISAQLRSDLSLSSRELS
jgi:hypothetical protein